MGKQKTSSTSKTNSNPSSSAPTLESHKPSAPRRKANVVKSGNAGSSKAALEAKAAAAANPSPAATLFGPNWTGKTPLSLLHEHCQRRSWDKPVIDARKLPGAQTFSGIVILKRKDDSVLLKPQDEVPIVCDTALEARHKAAVYGLFRFANGLNLKMTLPPSMRDYWSQLEQFKKSSTPKGMDWWWAADPFAAKPKPQPIAGHSGGGGQAGVSSNGSGPAQSRGKSGTSNDFDSTPVFRLPSHLQEQADTLLRKRMARSSVNSPSASGTATPISLQITDDQMSSVSSHLQRLGFGPSHVQSACHWLENSASSSSDKFIQTLLATRPLKDAALTYLQITLANAQLPPAFQSKSEDASIRLGGAKDAESLSLNWKARTVHDQTGFPLDATEQRMQAANGNEGLALDLLLRDLAGRFEEAQLLLSQSSKTSEQETESKQIWNEEVEALESIYAERFKQVHNAQSESFELTFPEHADVKLYAVRHSASSYPCVDGGIPTCVVQSDGLPPFLRLALSRSLFERMRQDDAKDMAEAGQGGLLSLSVEHLEDVLEDTLHRPPDPLVVLHHFLPKPVEVESTPAARLGTKPNGPLSTRQRHPNRRPGLTSADLSQHLKNLQNDPAFQKLAAKRQSLPAWSARRHVVDTIAGHQVTIIAGSTGSGKSTQCPAFLLDDAIECGQGADCHIVVTQPRRISAIGVATRVAQERCESFGRDGEGTVGYQIRGERRGGRHLVFATTGVLLRRLQGDPTLGGISHVVIDEVHERSLDNDVLLLELKELLSIRPDLKLILMSATLDDAILAYFPSAGQITIPGQTYPVEDFYLEDFMTHLNFKPGSIKAARNFSAAENGSLMQSLQDAQVAQEPASTIAMLVRSEKQNFDLVGHTVSWILRAKSVGGAILVFTSGVAEVNACIRAIETCKPSQASIKVFPLHAGLSKDEQTRVFQSMPPGVRKVIVATNVAETSITIDDVDAVVDTGRVKETRLDEASGLSKLVECWTSVASARQRRGRAGRVQKGSCFKLFTRWSEQNQMPRHTLPEMLRTPLESLVLTVKAARRDVDVRGFLSKAISPPSLQAIETATSQLRLLGALDEANEATPLGRHLSGLPIDLKLAKLLVMGALFGCLSSALDVAACLGSKPIFLSPAEQRDEAKEARSRLSVDNHHSDTLIDLKALQECMNMKSKTELKVFAEKNFISLAALEDIKGLRRDLVDALISSGSLSSPSQVATLSDREGIPALVSALQFASTCHLAKVKLPEARFEESMTGAIRKQHESREVRFFDETERVFIHPSSTLFSITSLRSGFLTYFEKVITSKPFVRQVAEVPLAAVLLFAPQVRPQPHGVKVYVGESESERGFPIKIPNDKVAITMSALRMALDQELEEAFEDAEQASQDSVLPLL